MSDKQISNIVCKWLFLRMILAFPIRGGSSIYYRKLWFSIILFDNNIPRDWRNFRMSFGCEKIEHPIEFELIIHRSWYRSLVFMVYVKETFRKLIEKIFSTIRFFFFFSFSNISRVRSVGYIKNEKKKYQWKGRRKKFTLNIGSSMLIIYIYICIYVRRSVRKQDLSKSKKYKKIDIKIARIKYAWWLGFSTPSFFFFFYFFSTFII